VKEIGWSFEGEAMTGMTDAERSYFETIQVSLFVFLLNAFALWLRLLAKVCLRMEALAMINVLPEKKQLDPVACFILENKIISETMVVKNQSYCCCFNTTGPFERLAWPCVLARLSGDGAVR